MNEPKARATMSLSILGHPRHCRWPVGNIPPANKLVEQGTAISARFLSRSARIGVARLVSFSNPVRATRPQVKDRHCRGIRYTRHISALRLRFAFIQRFSLTPSFQLHRLSGFFLSATRRPQGETRSSRALQRFEPNGVCPSRAPP